MQIKYYLNVVTNNDSYLTILLPKEVIEQCNLTHRDTFAFEVEEKSMSFRYDAEGKIKLAKNNSRLIFNINLKKLDEKLPQLLTENESRTLPAEIKGDKLIVDFSKLTSKPKGFGLFKKLNKGFYPGAISYHRIGGGENSKWITW